jgi:hypothetical protein
MGKHLLGRQETKAGWRGKKSKEEIIKSKTVKHKIWVEKNSNV